MKTVRKGVVSNEVVGVENLHPTPATQSVPTAIVPCLRLGAGMLYFPLTRHESLAASDSSGPQSLSLALE